MGLLRVFLFRLAFARHSGEGRNPVLCLLGAELRLAYGEPVTFCHCPKSNQKG
jgi:hypothetical protein